MNDFIKIYLEELSSFYRFEGISSFHYFDFNNKDIFPKTLNYIYFSKSKIHHNFYIKLKIKQLLNNEILKDTDLRLSKYVIVDYNKYKEIFKLIENFKLSNNMSIEVNVSPLIFILIENNYIFRHLKKKHSHYIERVDVKRPGYGGYGFSNEWLEVLKYLTYFYTYQRITKDDLLYFIDAYRYNIVQNNSNVNLVKFLNNTDRKTVRKNELAFDDFSKYALENTLKKIVEEKLYFSDSYLDKYKKEGIKKLIDNYCIEKEKLTENVIKKYQKII